ncbi:MAG: class I SAM-dependent methyltransferase [Bacteroidia bacterium]|nr:class I SAM-dependent methyltransferase [Bacteroidia bacterium]
MNSSEYTSTTKNWLDERFRLVSEEGIYIAHQPIYGFRRGFSESGNLKRYAITNQIVKALSHLSFDSLLDVGGAEGYKAALIKKLFMIDNVMSCDLSEEACKRSKEIFNIESRTIDIHQLPFEDNSFDVVVCSETLEHVEDLESATNELIRVAKKAVVITVSHEPKDVVEKNIKEKIPHAHIHSIHKNSFDFALNKCKSISHRKMLSKLMKPFFVIVDAQKLPPGKGFGGLIKRLFNVFVPLFKMLFGRLAVRITLYKDELFANTTLRYEGFCFVLLLDEKAQSKKKLRNYYTTEIVNFSVPYHYLDKSKMPQ